MAWWRRDPSLWCRSPIHRYSKRILYDPEAVLRSRSFSKSQAYAAQHRSDDDAKRPDGLSDLEWLRLQHLRRWKRLLQDDPYRALFGSSNDMLTGKGLKEWTWMYKTFPKWMMQEMELPEHSETQKPTGSTEAYKAAPPSQATTYPRKVDIVDEDPSKARGSLSKGVSHRTSQFEPPNHSSGIQSPSDSRRPRELDTLDNQSRTKPVNVGSSLGTSGQQQQPPTSTTAVKDAEAQDTQKETESRESTFIAEFLADTGNRPQTALDRRAALGVTPRSKEKRQSASDNVDAGPSARDEQPPPPIPSSQSGEGVGTDGWPRGYPDSISQSTESPGIMSFPVAAAASHEAGYRGPLSRSTESPGTDVHRFIRPWGVVGFPGTCLPNGNPVNSTAEPSKPRSTKDILRQLPEDDVDFLSPEEIRASMGARKSSTESAEEKQTARAKLEESFTDAQSSSHDLDPVFRGQVISDQYIRRTTRESKTAASQNSDISTNAPASQSPIETSVDRMTRWLQTGGDTLAKHFWSDPVHVKETQIVEKRSSDPQLKGLVARIQAGRQAMTQVYDTLPIDLPASTQLLERSKVNEKATMVAIGTALRLRADASLVETRRALSNRVETIRDALTKTQVESDTARKALDKSSKSSDEVNSQTISEATKSRLRTAALILEKTTKLTRQCIYSMQSRMELTQPLPHLREIGHHLLALQDTHLALLRLVERSLHVYGIEARPLEAQESSVQAQETVAASTTSDNNKTTPSPVEDETVVLSRKLAAQEKLEHEIQAQKSAMRGLSDDGYARVPKPRLTKTFDESNPLAHSLFRPFGLQLESLGKESENTENTEKTQISQALRDRALVREIKASYEDVYGPITVHHRQSKDIDGTEAEKTAAESKTRDERMVAESAVTNSVDSETGVPAAHDSKNPVPTEVVAEMSTTDTPGTDTVVSDTSSSVTSSKSAQDYLPASTENLHQEVLKTAAAIAAMSTEQPSAEVEAVEGSRKEPLSSLSNNSASREEGATLQHAATSAGTSTYRVLTYDPSTNEMSIITTSSATPSATASPVPIHEALATLDAPAEFLPHLQGNSEIVTAKSNLLVLRETSDTSMEFQRTIVSGERDLRDEEWNRVNPVDGTTRLSPTGFAGVEPDFRDEVQESSAKRNIDKEEKVEEVKKPYGTHFDKFPSREALSEHERILQEAHDKATMKGTGRKGNFWNRWEKRQLNKMLADVEGRREELERGKGTHNGKEVSDFTLLRPSRKATDRIDPNSRKGTNNTKGGFASVLKTGIVASALCYAAGVVGELMR